MNESREKLTFLVSKRYLQRLQNVKNVIRVFSALKNAIHDTFQVEFGCFRDIFWCISRIHVALFGRRHVGFTKIGAFEELRNTDG